MLRTESSRQGFRLTAVALPCPRRSFGTSHKGADPKLYANRRLVRSQEPLILLNSQKMSVGAECWLASLVIRSEGTYGRGDRRCSEGTAAVEGFPRAYKVPLPAQTNRKIQLSLRRNLCAAQSVPRKQGGAFFFTKKAYCVNETACVAGGRKSVQTQPHPFSPFKSPSKITGSKGI